MDIEFIPPMLLLRADRLREGPNWLYELQLDGEVVALDEKSRPSFNTLQNHGPSVSLHFFIFDLMIIRGRDVMKEKLAVSSPKNETSNVENDPDEIAP
jgi:ATP-dependent DNA ligase